MFNFFKRSPKSRRRRDDTPEEVLPPWVHHPQNVKLTNGDISTAFGGCSVAHSPPPTNPHRAGVKPCGHGTTPLLTGTVVRRDASAPSSPPPPSAVSATSIKTDANKICNNTVDGTHQHKKNLINQEAKFQGQVNELSKQLSARDAETTKLRFQMEQLERDVFTKSAGMERVRVELLNAQKEADLAKTRIRHLDINLIEFREKNAELTDSLKHQGDLHQRYERETQQKITELETLDRTLQSRVTDLEAELSQLQRDKCILDEQQAELLQRTQQEHAKLTEDLQTAKQQCEQIETKWQQDFELLRTVSLVKEQQLLDDFEWKLREVQQQCKRKLQEKENALQTQLQDAYEEVQAKMQEIEELLTQVEQLKSFESEMDSLRSLIASQEETLKTITSENTQLKLDEAALEVDLRRLRNLVEIEKENLQHMVRKHQQELNDKDRNLKQLLHQKRIEIAMYWEERLLTECNRLKMELDVVHTEEKNRAMESVRQEQRDEFERIKLEWEAQIQQNLHEMEALRQSLDEKDDYYHEEIIRAQTSTDRDIFELRRLMDKIDMTHHERFEKLVEEHDLEIEKLNKDWQMRLEDVEQNRSNQIQTLNTSLDVMQTKMEEEAQRKIERLIAEHRDELDSQWENLLQQKGDAIQLVQDEYLSKFQMLEEQMCTQQKAHSAREVDLLKTIDSLKNELCSTKSAVDDLQSNCDTLEGAIQVLNAEIARNSDVTGKERRETQQKIKSLEATIRRLQEQLEKDAETARLKLMATQKQSQESIDHLHRKCQCLTKLFEEVRQRYEKRESRKEDLTIISDLRQVIAEQEKDLNCINEEKRYCQMRLMALLGKSTDQLAIAKVDNDDEEDDDEEEQFQDAPKWTSPDSGQMQLFSPSSSIPPTIPECDE